MLISYYDLCNLLFSLIITIIAKKYSYLYLLLLIICIKSPVQIVIGFLLGLMLPLKNNVGFFYGKFTVDYINNNSGYVLAKNCKVKGNNIGSLRLRGGKNLLLGSRVFCLMFINNTHGKIIKVYNSIPLSPTYLQNCRKSISNFLELSKHSALLKYMLLGDGSEITHEKPFAKIIGFSLGFNISLLMGAIYFLFIKLFSLSFTLNYRCYPQIVARGMSLLGGLAYHNLTGNISSLRALLVMLVSYIIKPVNKLKLTTIIALIIIIFQPNIIFSRAFQFSFIISAILSIRFSYLNALAISTALFGSFSLLSFILPIANILLPITILAHITKSKFLLGCLNLILSFLLKIYAIIPINLFLPNWHLMLLFPLLAICIRSKQLQYFYLYSILIFVINIRLIISSLMLNVKALFGIG